MSELPEGWEDEFYFWTDNSEDPCLGHQNAADTCEWELVLRSKKPSEVIAEAKKHKQQCVDPQPKHGDSGTCAKCGGEIEFYEGAVYPAGSKEKEVLTTWWAHRVHPTDGHDAVLGGPA